MVPQSRRARPLNTSYPEALKVADKSVSAGGDTPRKASSSIATTRRAHRDRGRLRQNRSLLLQQEEGHGARCRPDEGSTPAISIAEVRVGGGHRRSGRETEVREGRRRRV